MSLAILFHLLCAQHVSDINISIFRSLRLCWWITSRNKNSNTQRTENKTTDVVIHQHTRKLLKMDILMSETCWAHNKWNKIASDIKLVFNSSTIAMMHGPINIRVSSPINKFYNLVLQDKFLPCISSQSSLPLHCTSHRIEEWACKNRTFTYERTTQHFHI